MTQAAQVQLVTCESGAGVNVNAAIGPQRAESAPSDATALSMVEKLYALTLYSGGILATIFVFTLFISGWRGGAFSIFVLWIGTVLALKMKLKRLSARGSS